MSGSQAGYANRPFHAMKNPLPGSLTPRIWFQKRSDALYNKAR